MTQEEEKELAKIVNDIFVVNVNYQAFSSEEWNEEIAPKFREIKSFVSKLLEKREQKGYERGKGEGRNPSLPPRRTKIMTLNEIIEKAREKFKKDFVGKGTCGHTHILDENNHYPNATGIIDFISLTISDAIETAFKETEESRFDDSVDADSVSFPDGEIHAADYKKGYRDALAEVKKKQEEFMR